MKRVTRKTTYKLFVSGIVIALCFSAMAMTVFADNGNASSAMGSLVDFIIDIFKYVGIIAIVIGIGFVGMSLNSHDSTQRMGGFLAIGGGVLVVFAKSIINMIGITW